MAEENLSPISAPKPPAVNPLGTATATHASTLKLKPVIRKPAIGGGAGGGLRPGLRLPTQKGLKPGLKLPTQTAKPVAAPAASTPAPAPTAAPAAAPAASDSLEQLKNMTQKLKGVTQPIPQQAILRKTGIIADQGLTDAQKQASKSRTARISLSDAMGVAPVQNEATPMKTIRIKRPVDLQPSPAAAPVPAPVAPAAPAAAPAEKAAAPAPTLTQRKTLKIARPAGGAVRPTGKSFGVKKPGATVLTKPSADGSDVADIPDIPDVQQTVPTISAPPVPTNEIADVPAGLAVFDLILQVAACVGVFFLSYLLYLDAEMQWF